MISERNHAKVVASWSVVISRSSHAEVVALMVNSDRGSTKVTKKEIVKHG